MFETVPTSLTTKEAVFAEAKRVSATARWAHLASLYRYAKESFEVSAQEFVEETGLGIAPHTLYMWGRYSVVYFQIPRTQRKLARVTICRMIEEDPRYRKNPTKKTANTLFAELLKTKYPEARIRVYFSGMSNLARMLKDDVSILGDMSDVFIARKWDDAEKLQQLMYLEMQKRWRWDIGLGKYVPKAKAS